MSNKGTVAQCFQVEPPTKGEVNALKALADGKAGEYEQQQALNFIVNNLCRANDVLYVHGNNALDTAFLNGRAFPGQQILKYLKVPIGRLKLKNSEEDDNNG